MSHLGGWFGVWVTGYSVEWKDLSILLWHHNIQSLYTIYFNFKSMESLLMTTRPNFLQSFPTKPLKYPSLTSTYAGSLLFAAVCSMKKSS